MTDAAPGLHGIHVCRKQQRLALAIAPREHVARRVLRGLKAKIAETPLEFGRDCILFT